MSAIVKNFDMSGIVKKLHRVRAAVHEPLQQLVREQSRLFVSSTGNVPGLAQLIPPSHEGVKGASAGKHGKSVVRADISKVYATPGQAYALIEAKNPAAAKAFWVAIKGRGQKTKSGKYRKNARGAADLVEAQRILTSLGGRLADVQILSGFDGGELHRQSRRTGGRVTRRTPAAIITDSRELAVYVKKRMDNVGLLASMLNQPAAMLGAKGIPRFVEQHGNKLGAPVTFLTTDHSFYIVIDVSVPYGAEHFMHRIPYVIKYREAALARSWPYVKRYLASRADLQRAAT